MQPTMNLQRIEIRSASQLRPHPRNVAIYGDANDPGMTASVRDKGILNPLLITEDGRIIAGHRRWTAANNASLSNVPVVVFGSTDEWDILEALVESNRQRDKDLEIKGREYNIIQEVEAARAKARQLAALKQNQTDTTVEITLSQRKESNGKSRDKAAEKVGVSGMTGARAGAVVQAIDKATEEGNTAVANDLKQILKKKGASPAYTAAVKAGYIAPTYARQSNRKTIKEVYSIAEWTKLDVARSSALISNNQKAQRSGPTCNEQTGDSIEWAMWSWNPVTGCLHDCSYCYARDIANRFYTQKFVPSIVPSALSAPYNTKVPTEAKDNIGYKNIFTCSMADLFGRWVPAQWINAVLHVCEKNPQWNFLFLTKFPNRLPEFDFPDNAWVGTTVDAQARIANAEAAFAKVNAKVKWLSCEPLLEPLKFNRLDLFDWMAIGGASASNETPAFRPPREWIVDLEQQAKDANCLIYEKANLLSRIREYPGQERAASMDMHEQFNMGYIQRDILAPQNYHPGEVIDQGIAFAAR